MSKYFAKYLPVEGEIKSGEDWVYYEEDDSFFKAEDNFNNVDLGYMNAVGSYHRAKLFLCSRDIQVGDTYYYSDTETDTCDSEVMLEQTQEQEQIHGQKRFKVIGEISPEATWVKEGDEVDEDEVMKGYNWSRGLNNKPLWKSEEDIKKSVGENYPKDFMKNETPVYQIKGPRDHFH